MTNGWNRKAIVSAKLVTISTPIGGTRAQPRGIGLPGTIFGIGLGEFVDGSLLHQILQWHHMLPSAATPATSERSPTADRALCVSAECSDDEIWINSDVTQRYRGPTRSRVGQDPCGEERQGACASMRTESAITTVRKPDLRILFAAGMRACVRIMPRHSAEGYVSTLSHLPSGSSRWARTHRSES